jgi:uncharacterized protein YfaS (alpha-2-macroglobulin family)
MTAPIVERPLQVGQAAAPSPKLVVRNTGTTVLYPRLILSGLPAAGSETAAASGLALEVAYLTTEGKPLDPSRLPQGTDFKAVVKVTNDGARGDYQEIALSQVFASGFEIRNDRMDPSRRRASGFEHQDVRDDRVLTYFDLRAGETKTVAVGLNASYLGRYYLPMVTAEAMYDASIHARAKGQWVEVTAPGE